MFYVGQKVRCVDDRPTTLSGVRELKRGLIYTVRWEGSYTWPPGLVAHALWLEGFKRDEGPDCPAHSDVPFMAMRFRPLVEKKTDISVFTALLKPKRVDA